MPAITALDLNNAKLDVDFIAEIATSTAPTATNRLGHVNATMAAANNAIAQTAAGQATFARLGAEAARDAALIQAGVYVDEPTGRSAVANGQAFKVQGSGEIAAFEYRRVNSDSSTLITTYPSATALVTPIRTNFLIPGKNLFNPRAVTVGKYITSGGSLFDNASYDTSDYIPVVPGPYKCSEGIRFSCNFDANKMVVPGGYDGENSVDNLIIPTGVSFVRLAVAHDPTLLQFESGTVSTSFEEYYYELRTPNGTPIYTHGDSPTTAITESPSVAATHYISNGKEISFYLENIVRNYLVSKGRIRISADGGKETGVCTKITATDSQIGSVLAGNAAVAGESLSYTDSVSNKSFQVLISNSAKTTPVNIQNIGDSFTGRMTWANVINSTPAFSGITYSGNRTANSTNQTVKCEGQGGWTMESYFTVDNRGYLSPFMQPMNNFKHFGPTSFWIDANSPSPSYNATYFFGVRDQFDSNTGRKKSPNINDVMSDGSGYIVWNGSAWVSITLSELGGFAFNYGKYRATWSIPRPDILHVLLGTNDFYSVDEGTFPGVYNPYKTRYDQLIASVKADSPLCKIIVGIPVSSARQGEDGTLLTERVKQAMWLLATNLNNDYSGKESQNIFLVDYHSIVDRTYGFDFTLEKPFSDYSGTDRYKYYSDITHCSVDGFNQMGNVYMGLIQYLR